MEAAEEAEEEEVPLLLVAADEATFESTPVTADAASEDEEEPSEERSSPESLVRLLSTLEELLLFTRFLEPEIRPVRNELLFLSWSSPLMFEARVMMLLMLLALARSSLPSALYWV